MGRRLLAGAVVAAPPSLLALVTLAVPIQAAAFPAGGVFAGPTRQSGSSVYWNPAALAREPSGWGTYLDVTLLVVGAGFERAGADPNTGIAHPRADFVSLAPNLQLSFTAPTPWEPLRIAIGGFAPAVSGTDWPQEGPTRWFGRDNRLVSYTVVGGFVLGRDWWGLSVMAGPAYGILEVRNARDFGGYANGLLGADLFGFEDPALEGDVEILTDDWSAVLVAGGYIEPLDWLRFGVGFVWLEDLVLSGTVEVLPPESLDTILPGYELRGFGNIELLWKLPWALNFETELNFGGLSVAALVQFQNKSVRDNILGVITEASPQILEGDQLAVVNSQDDWLFAARLGYRINDDWEVGLRVDADPRAVPSENITPINVDFTTFEITAGVAFDIDQTTRATFSYSYVHAVPFEVTNSAFNPRAPPDSGFGSPSANGHYDALGHKFVLTFNGLWGAE